MNNKLAVITVVYNNYKVLDDFLKSLEKQVDQNFHLFVTDNSTKKQKIKTKLKNITMIDSPNLGYSHGVNTGLKTALEKLFDRFCVINNDVYFEKNFVEKALSSLESNVGSIIGGKIYYAPGYEYHKDRYSGSDRGKVIWYAGGDIDWKHALISHRGVDEVDDGQYERGTETEFITGCLTLFDKEVLDKVGFWDESYFLYYEDADWCVRAKNAGVRLIFDPTIIIWHKNSESTGKPGSPIHVKYQNRNRLCFGMKYAPFRTKLHLLKNYFFDFLKLK